MIPLLFAKWSQVNPLSKPIPQNGQTHSNNSSAIGEIGT